MIDGCNAVANSPYSRVFGVPMAYFGFIYYLYMFALAARLAFEPLSRGVRFRAVLYAGMGAASSVYFMYLQLGFISELVATVSFQQHYRFFFSSRRCGTLERQIAWRRCRPASHPPRTSTRWLMVVATVVSKPDGPASGQNVNCRPAA